jgi:spore coat polysaccharide biosynthesis protein SpsF
LAGEPALLRLIERIKPCHYVDEIVVATTTNDTDNPIIELCQKNGIKYFRGSEQDVLKRVLNAAKSVNAHFIIEITGDCPLLDYRHINELCTEYEKEEFDYIANNTIRTYSDGFDVQLFPVEILDRVDKLTNDPIDRVHVSYYIYTHPETFKCKNISAVGKMDWPEQRVTLDEKEDYILISKVFEELYPKNRHFSAEDVVDLLRSNKQLAGINGDIKGKSVLEG